MGPTSIIHDYEQNAAQNPAANSTGALTDIQKRTETASQILALTEISSRPNWIWQVVKHYADGPREFLNNLFWLAFGRDPRNGPPSRSPSPKLLEPRREVMEEGVTFTMVPEKNEQMATGFYAWLSSAASAASNVAYAPVSLVKQLFSVNAHIWKDRKWRLGLIAIARDLQDRHHLDFSRLPEANSPLSQALTKTFTILISPYYEDSHKQYKEFLKALRNTISIAESQEQEIVTGSHQIEMDWLNKIVDSLFIAEEPMAFGENLVKLIVKDGLGRLAYHQGSTRRFEELENLPFADRMTAYHEAIYWASPELKTSLVDLGLQSARGTLGIDFDNAMQINARHTLFHYRWNIAGYGGHEATNVRMGTPVSQDGAALEVNPEWRQLMRTLREKQQHWLYMSYQRRLPSSKRDVEPPRAICMEEFGEENADVLTFVTLDKDSAWYEQEGACAKGHPKDLFLCDLLESLFSQPSTGIFFSPALRTQEAQGRIWEHFSAKLNEHFKGKEYLTVDDRRAFIQKMGEDLQKDILEISSKTGVEIAYFSYSAYASCEAGTVAEKVKKGLLREGSPFTLSQGIRRLISREWCSQKIDELASSMDPVVPETLLEAFYQALCEEITEQEAKEFPNGLVIVTKPEEVPFFGIKEIYRSNLASQNSIVQNRESQPCSELFRSDTSGHTFLHHYYYQLFHHPKSPYYFPKSVQTQKFQNKAWNDLAKAYWILFGDRQDISIDDKKNLIELSYVFFCITLLKETGANFFGQICKDCIDRGAISNALFYAIMLIARYGKMTAEAMQDLLTMTFAPALFVRNRKIILHRLSRLIQVLEALREPEVIERLQAWWKEQGEDLVWMEKQKDQELKPHATTATTYKDYETALNLASTVETAHNPQELLSELASDNSLFTNLVELWEGVSAPSVFLSDLDKGISTINGEKMTLPMDTPDRDSLAAKGRMAHQKISTLLDQDKRLSEEQQSIRLRDFLGLGHQFLCKKLEQSLRSMLLNKTLDMNMVEAHEDFKPHLWIDLILDPKTGSYKVVAQNVCKIFHDRQDEEEELGLDPIYIQGCMELDLTSNKATTGFTVLDRTKDKRKGLGPYDADESSWVIIERE